MEAVLQAPLRPEDQHPGILALRHLDCATGLRALGSGRDGSMRSKRVILRRVAFAVVALAAVAAFSGCSSVEPTDSWGEATGRVSGTVRTEADCLVPEIEVCLWTEPGVEGIEMWYQTETDQYGAFEFDAVEMTTEESEETTYWIGANRTAARSNAIDTNYTSSRSTVTVPRNGECTSHMVIDDDPGDPDTYIED